MAVTISTILEPTTQTPALSTTFEVEAGAVALVSLFSDAGEVTGRATAALMAETPGAAAPVHVLGRVAVQVNGPFKGYVKLNATGGMAVGVALAQ